MHSPFFVLVGDRLLRHAPSERLPFYTCCVAITGRLPFAILARIVLISVLRWSHRFFNLLSSSLLIDSLIC